MTTLARSWGIGGLSISPVSITGTTDNGCEEDNKMTIDEAIKILTEWHWPDATHPWKDMEDAIKLGIEALKVTQRNRKYLYKSGEVPLPGETKD